MKLTNIKNVVIWTLIMINVLFLAFYLFGIYMDGANKARTYAELAALFDKNGIVLNTRNIGEGGVMAEYSTSQNVAEERRLAESLLGSVSKIDEGGNIYSYVGDAGQAKFTGGEFAVTLKPGVRPDGGDALKASGDILKTLQIETASVMTDGDAEIVAVCAVDRYPVFNCRVTLTFEEGSLSGLSGKLAADIRPTGEKRDMTSPATALMAFLRSVKNSTITCTRIEAVEPGYILNETSVLGKGSLQPAWRIDTGAEFFTFNTVTGKIEQSMAQRIE